MKENFSENSLKLWQRSLRYCSLKLKDPNVIIRVRPMIYYRQDIDGFDNQLQELKKLEALTLAQLLWSETMLKLKEEKLEW